MCGFFGGLPLLLPSVGQSVLTPKLPGTNVLTLLHHEVNKKFTSTVRNYTRPEVSVWKCPWLRWTFFFQDGCFRPSPFFISSGQVRSINRVQESLQAFHCCRNEPADVTVTSEQYPSNPRRTFIPMISAVLHLMTTFVSLFSLKLGPVNNGVKHKTWNADYVAFHSPLSYQTNGSTTCLRNTTMAVRGVKQKEAQNS